MRFSGWKKTRLEEIGIIVTGKTPSTKIEENFGNQYMFITPRDMDDSKNINRTERNLSDRGISAVTKQILKGRSICVSCIGSDMGKVALCIGDCVTNQQINSITNVNENYDVDFVYYVLKPMKEYFHRIAGGSTMPIVNKSRFSEIEIDVPNIEEQKLIAHILSTLDEKIEVNNQINKTLEKMAQAIFKQWFVDFEFPNEAGEPYKSSGGEMVESELGMIPEGWEVGNFLVFINNMLGGDWGKAEPQDNYNIEVNCIRGADINDVIKGNKGNLPNRFILEKNYIKKNLKEGDLVVEISGGSPTQSTGRIAYISKELLDRYKNPLVCTNFCRAIELKEKDNMEYIYQYWKSEYNTGIFFNYENGTTGIKNLDISSFVEKHEVVIPTNQILEKYCKLVRKINKTIQINGVENYSLSLLRDTLLPKLMSGEIIVPLDSEGEAL